MFKKVLIANRGAIACRIIRTLDRMGIASVAIYSDADRLSRHVRMAGEAVRIGPPPAVESYLDTDAILAAAKATGADAVHPGYGFLSENTAFADACTAAGITFIGPTPDNIRAFALKHTARALAEEAGVPLAPGSGLIETVDAAREAAEDIGYPVMLKSTAGGGGIGLQRVDRPEDLAPTFERVKRLAANNFKDAGVFIEKFVARGRHIEVQIFGDGKGRVVALGERDCSAQRRNQKVVEETPASNLPASTRADMLATAVRLGQTVNYANAGTVEYLYDVDTGAFYFLEVNTRLQVEHGVTEQVTGVDLVEWMIRQAAGEDFLPSEVPEPSGASIQVRIYAEDPARDFRPSAGLLTEVAWPDDARIETWVESGTEVPPFYDPMIGKLIVTGSDRRDALHKLADALANTRLSGIETNLSYLRALATAEPIVKGQVITTTLADFVHVPATIEVVQPGTQTSVQDYPGRLGYWDVGVPPSGPMDARSFQLANRAVGNPPDAAGLEITLAGPTLTFLSDTVICLTGAELGATLDDKPVARYVPVPVKQGQTLVTGAPDKAGIRAYLAVRGGIDVPLYLGSRSTFSLGQFGGHGGRTLRIGDVLHIATPDAALLSDPVAIPQEVQPELTKTWRIGVLYGPHGAPEFFTEDDIKTFFDAEWEVHYNSSRTGVRLIGPKPNWARSDGGEAGLHPSNLHDNAYGIGAVNFTGDMPVILGPDGPSLGGFVCPVTVVSGELWKVGQLRPGDKVRFERLTATEAESLAARRRQEISTLNATPSETIGGTDRGLSFTAFDGPIVGGVPDAPDRPRVVYRRAGDSYLLVEYGDIVLDIELRFRVHALQAALTAADITGIIDLTPGVRSLQIHFDPSQLQMAKLIATLETLDARLDDADDITVASRIVHLPLSWNDPTIQVAIDKYTQLVRPDAPWCPSNIEFIRRINGLDSVDDVYRIIFDANYLVLGLGDVYLGAPLATPTDPRHRLVTTKYNPARTWTADGMVGIGGAYLCIYGMEGPGGYQLFGRTVQTWNTYRATDVFEAGQPWLLRFFDQIRFYPVSSEKLAEIRTGLIDGTHSLEITEATFSLKDYRAFLAAHSDEIGRAKARQQAAFEAERSRWKKADQTASAQATVAAPPDEVETLKDGEFAITSAVPGSVWKIPAPVGTTVRKGDTIIVIESMKMEMSVTTPSDGVVVDIRCSEGKPVSLGQTLAVVTATPQRDAT